jgi:organic hydroperoxide reductase OsmC/OhrA
MVAPPSRDRLRLSADPAFFGDAQLMNPESLVLAAASSCQMLSFLAAAARARVDVVAYEDDAEAVMPEDVRPVRITEIRLRPRITARSPATQRRILALSAVAHRECYVANTLSCEILLAPEVEILDS